MHKGWGPDPSSAMFISIALTTFHSAPKRFCPGLLKVDDSGVLLLCLLPFPLRRKWPPAAIGAAWPPVFARHGSGGIFKLSLKCLRLSVNHELIKVLCTDIISSPSSP